MWRWLDRQLRYLGRGWRAYGKPRLAYLLSYLRSPYQIIKRWPEGAIELGPKVAIFIHFDSAGAVRDHVLGYVAALQEAGYSVAFVTNSGKLRPAALAALQPLCAAVLIRRNIGYDFGAMREGIHALDMPRPNTEQLLLVNDSVYGPVTPMDDMLARINFDEADFWGATESWQARYHLQSYFLAFGQTAMGSKAWRDFWRSVRPVPSKVWVIFRYEIGLTQRLLRGGLRCRAIWPYPELVKQVDPVLLSEGASDGPVSTDPIVNVRKVHARRIRDAAVSRVPLNPTSDLWRQLLLAGYPFVKRELLRDNPSGVSDVSDWRDVVVQIMGGDATLIERDLQRVLKNLAP